MAAKSDSPARPSRRGFLKRTAAAGAAGAAVSAGSVWFGAGARAESDDRCGTGGDIALVNGRILTMDAQGTTASALLVRGGRIVEVGHRGEFGECARTIDLRGRTVIPGLIDSHVHFVRNGTNPGYEVRIIETATSISEIQQMIFNRARSVPPGQFITCYGGWNRNGLAEQRLPTPAELDAAAPLNPVFLGETGGGGQGVTNSSGAAFFSAHGVTVAADGTVAAGGAFAALQAVETDADKQRGTGQVIEFANSLGLTMIHDHGGLIGLSQYQFVLSLWGQHALNMRYRPWFWSGDDTGFTEEQARIVNNFNKLGDDVFHPLGVGERINNNTTNPGFIGACEFAAQNGWALTQHSLTPAEVAFHISAYQAAAAYGPIDKLRWSLCHVDPITPAQIATVQSLGICLNIQGYGYTRNSTSVPSGPPFRSLVEAGIPLGGGTDATVVAALNPWLSMYFMTTGRNNAGAMLNPGQTISRLQALPAVYMRSAYLSFDDDKLGSLEKGKLADLAVLSDNPLTVSDDRFRRISSVLTLQAGRIVYQAPGLHAGDS